MLSAPLGSLGTAGFRRGRAWVRWTCGPSVAVLLFALLAILLPTMSSARSGALPPGITCGGKFTGALTPIPLEAPGIALGTSIYWPTPPIPKCAWETGADKPYFQVRMYDQNGKLLAIDGVYTRQEAPGATYSTTFYVGQVMVNFCCYSWTTPARPAIQPDGSKTCTGPGICATGFAPPGSPPLSIRPVLTWGDKVSLTSTATTSEAVPPRSGIPPGVSADLTKMNELLSKAIAEGKAGTLDALGLATQASAIGEIERSMVTTYFGDKTAVFGMGFVRAYTRLSELNVHLALAEFHGTTQRNLVSLELAKGWKDTFETGLQEYGKTAGGAVPPGSKTTPGTPAAPPALPEVACACSGMSVKTQGRGEIPGVSSPGYDHRTEDFFTAVWTLACTKGKGGCEGEVEVSVLDAANPGRPTDVTVKLVPHQDARSKQTVTNGGLSVGCTVKCNPEHASTTGGSFMVKLFSLLDLSRAVRSGKTYDVILKTFCGAGGAHVLESTKTMPFVFKADGSLDPKASHYAQ